MEDWGIKGAREQKKEEKKKKKDRNVSLNTK